jgi:hypothetical protein
MRVLDALDHLLVAVIMGSERLGRRHSHRLARAVRAAAVSGHGAMWRVATLAGLAAAPAAMVRAALAVSVKDAPRFPVPVIGTVTPLASALVEGRYLFHGGATVPVDRLSWLRPFSELPDVPLDRHHFHALDGVRQLVDAHGLGAGPAYLDAARRVTRRWISEGLFSERGRSIWSDHTTAVRALVLVQLWVAGLTDEGADPRFTRSLYTALVRHAARLAHPAFYRAEHNHGITQAYALLALGVVLAPHPDAPAWLRLGRARLEAQVADNVSAEGVHREHTPAYQQYVLLQLLCGLRFARAHGVTLSADFERRLVTMVEAATHMLKPDGRLSALGDGSVGSAVLVRPEDLLDCPDETVAEYAHAVTCGTTGRTPKHRDAVFPGGGCAFLRSGWGGGSARSGTESFLSLRLATFPTTHVHRDLLSFELHAFGEDLVVDSGGPGVYPLRAWLKTTGAHNTVSVDGADQGITAAHLRATRLEPGWALLDAEHEAYPGVRHRRILVYRRSSGELLVIDRLEAARRHRYALFFHLAPDLTPFREGLAVRTRSATGGPSLELVPLLTSDLSLTVHRGVQHPPQGWVQVAARRTRPNATLEYHREAAGSVTFATALVPAPAGIEGGARARLEGGLLEGDARVSVSSSQGSWAIGFDGTGRITAPEPVGIGRP